MRQKIGFALSIALVGAIILSTRFYEVDLPVWHFFGGGRGLDPASLHLAGEFVESNLGTAREPDGSYTVRLLAQQYLFVPHCIEVPAGVPVRFRITSYDNVHVINLNGTPESVRAIPGTVSETTFTFPQTAEFDAACREFCGPGHYAMRAHVRVVTQDQFSSLHPDQRRSCDAP